MLDIGAAMESVCAGIRAQGVRATVDERDVNLPCVLLRPPELSWRFGQGRFDASWTALVIVEDTGRPTALSRLGELIGLAARGIGAAVLTGRPADVTLPDTATPLPCYEMTWTSKILEES